jgi:hypothetical protein
MRAFGRRKDKKSISIYNQLTKKCKATSMKKLLEMGRRLKVLEMK